QAPLHPLAGPPDKRGKRPPATALDLSQGHAGAHRRGHLNILAEQGGGAIEAPRMFKIADMAQPRQELKMVAIVELGLSLAGSAQNRDANAAGSRSSRADRLHRQDKLMAVATDCGRHPHPSGKADRIPQIQMLSFGYEINPGAVRRMR